MSQKSSVPQAAKFVSQALKRDSGHANHVSFGFEGRPANGLRRFNFRQSRILVL
jgi:hypothetical protein